VEIMKFFSPSNTKYFIIAFIITSLIFVTILFFNKGFDNERERAVNEKMTEVINEYEDVQTLIIMSELYGENATCLAFSSILYTMNKGLWTLGIKIDQYRQVAEQFATDPFYIKQKKDFNRKEVLYFTMLNKMQDICKLNGTIVSYFYKKKEDCPDCDSQSFVLSDIKNDNENTPYDEDLSIFSFDADIGLPAISMLISYYNITEYPALVIGNQKYQGLKSKKELKSILCSEGFYPGCLNFFDSNN
jgi:hypothetical protein